MANRRNMLYSVCLIVLVAISAFYQLPAGLINQSAHSPAKQLIDPPLSVPPRYSVVANPPGYLRQAAYGYALQWYDARNNHYNDYTSSGGDCANFVSQCLIAGGISLYNGTDGTGYGVYPDKDRPTGHSNGTMPYCDYLDLNLRNFQNTHVTGPLTSPTVPDEMTVGDVVIFGNSTGDNYEHATIVVWDGGSQLGLAAHTTDVWNQSFFSYMSEFSCATFYHFVDSTAEYYRFMVNSSIGSLNVRVGPGKNGMPTPQYYDAIGTLLPNQEYIAFGTATWQGKIWWHFWFDDRAAWCAQQGETYNYTIDVTGDGNLQPVEVVVNTALNVRDGPGTSYAIFGQVYNGMRFVSNSSSGGYYEYWYSGVSKYSSGSYMLALNESLPLPPPMPSNKTVMGFLPYWESANQNFTPLTIVAWFSEDLNPDGSIANRHGWPVTSVAAAVHAAGRKIVLTATMFNSSNIHALLSSNSSRTAAANKLLTEVKNGNGDGVCIDFETPTYSSDKANLVTFVQLLNSTFKAWRTDSHVSICTPAVDWYDTFDYSELATYADALMVMAYDYYWSGSSNAGPCDPLQGGSYNIENTVADYLSNGCPASKLVLGLPFYGYDYPVSSTAEQAATRGRGSAILYSSSLAKIAQYSARVYYDSTFETGWYNYYVSGDGWHQVWCDNLTSLGTRFDYVLQQNLSGIGIWAWGYQGSHTDLENLIYAIFFANMIVPQVNITAPANNSVLEQSAVTVTWTGTDNCNIQSYELSVENGVWQKMGLNTSFEVAGLSAGVHNVTVRLNDTNDNSYYSWVNFTIGVTGDTTPPWVCITVPANQSTTGQSSVLVMWVGSDNMAVAAYSLSVEKGPWVFQGLNTSAVVAGLANGPHNVTVRANDTSDNVNSSIVLFTVNTNLDTTPPSIQVTSPPDGSRLHNSSVTIQWNGTDNCGIFNYLVAVDGGLWYNNGTSTTLQCVFADGFHTVSVCANDTSSNNATATVTFWVDTSDVVPPSVWFLVPPDYIATDLNLVQFAWNGTDNVGVAAFSLSIDGGDWVNLDLATEGAYYLADGMHEVQIRATDVNGNTAENATYVTVDTQPPTLSVNIPSALVGQPVTLSWTATDTTTNVTQVQVLVDGVQAYAGTGTSCQLSPYDTTGNHSVEVLATDYVGHTTIVNGTLVVSAASSGSSTNPPPENPPAGNSLMVYFIAIAGTVGVVVGLFLVVRKIKAKSRDPKLYYPKISRAK